MLSKTNTPYSLPKYFLSEASQDTISLISHLASGFGPAGTNTVQMSHHHVFPVGTNLSLLATLNDCSFLHQSCRTSISANARAFLKLETPTKFLHPWPIPISIREQFRNGPSICLGERSKGYSEIARPHKPVNGRSVCSHADLELPGS